MKDEIEQMIDNLKFISEQESATIEINQNGCKVILDCITNLKEENENKNNKISELQQELLNKKLNIKDIEYKEKMIYKSRNEKAVELLNKTRSADCDYSQSYCLVLEAIDVLNGDDESVKDQR